MNKTPWHLIVAVTVLIALFLAFLYTVRGILPPFLIAFAIAWLLDPLLVRLQRRGCPRILAVSGVYIVFLAAFVVGLIFLVPAIVDQAKELARDFPSYSERFSAFAAEFMKKHRSILIKFELPTTLREVFAKYGDTVSEAIKTGINYATGFIVANLSKVLWFILIPLVAFYFLNDMDRIRKKAALFIPERVRPRTTEVLSRMGVVFSNYVRGLLIVCLLYGIATTGMLTAFKLKYGIILGLLAGVLYAVPYLGAILTTLLVFLVGLATYKYGVAQAWAPAVAQLALNQVFDMLVTPRVLGRSVGLHPVISLFALMAGAQLFGLVGMILAVPVAASIQEIFYEFYPALRSVSRKKQSKRKRTPRRSKSPRVSRSAG